ncbi:MAG: sugar ABC transporter permease, partial [Blautia coccoides]
MNRKNAQRRFVFACLAPAVVLVVLFIFVPTVNVFRMSLYRMGGITNKKEFVGLYNFKTLMGDKNFLQAMQ